MSNVYCYAHHFYGFGDFWACVSHAIITSTDRQIYIHKDTSPISLQKMREIYPLFKTTYRFQVTDKPITRFMFFVQDHHEPYVPTKLTWKSQERFRNALKKPIVTLQIEKNSSSNTHLMPFKHLKPTDLMEWRKLLIKLMDKIDFVTINKNQTVEQSLKLLTLSSMHISICSGSSHMAHSIGTPLYLFDFHGIDWYHPNKQYTKFHTFKDIIPKIFEIAESK